MGVIFQVLEGLSPVRDEEVLEGYARYEGALNAILTADQLQTYADHLAQSGEIRIFEEMSSDELLMLPGGMPGIAAAIIADTTVTMENRRVAALLNQYGEHNVTPDYQQTSPLR